MADEGKRQALFTGIWQEKYFGPSVTSNRSIVPWHSKPVPAFLERGKWLTDQDRIVRRLDTIPDFSTDPKVRMR